jgi:hypothetical protein
MNALKILMSELGMINTATKFSVVKDLVMILMKPMHLT